MMLSVKEKPSKNRYQEIIEELARLTDLELHSYYLDFSYKHIIQDVLEYKQKISDTTQLFQSDISVK